MFCKNDLPCIRAICYYLFIYLFSSSCSSSSVIIIYIINIIIIYNDDVDDHHYYSCSVHICRRHRFYIPFLLFPRRPRGYARLVPRYITAVCHSGRLRLRAVLRRVQSSVHLHLDQVGY